MCLKNFQTEFQGEEAPKILWIESGLGTAVLNHSYRARSGSGREAQKRENLTLGEKRTKSFEANAQQPKNTKRSLICSSPDSGDGGALWAFSETSIEICIPTSVGTSLLALLTS